MCGFVLFHNVGLDTAAGIDLQSLAGSPQPDFAGILGTGTSRPGPPAGLPGCFGKATQYLTQFACMNIIEIDRIFDAIKGKQKCFTCLGAVEVIFQKGYYSLCHKIKHRPSMDGPADVGSARLPTLHSKRSACTRSGHRVSASRVAVPFLRRLTCLRRAIQLRLRIQLAVLYGKFLELGGQSFVNLFKLILTYINFRKKDGSMVFMVAVMRCVIQYEQFT